MLLPPFPVQSTPTPRMLLSEAAALSAPLAASEESAAHPDSATRSPPLDGALIAASAPLAATRGNYASVQRAGPHQWGWPGGLQTPLPGPPGLSWPPGRPSADCGDQAGAGEFLALQTQLFVGQTIFCTPTYRPSQRPCFLLQCSRGRIEQSTSVGRVSVLRARSQDRDKD